MQAKAAAISTALNRCVEAFLVLLLTLLVLDVWIGVMDRYLFHWQLPWPEILARYLMIWVALLAISSGVARREHIGLTILIDRLPARMRQSVLIGCDVFSSAVDGSGLLVFFMTVPLAITN